MEENQPSNEEDSKYAEELMERVNYVRRWLDCAPDFPVLTEALLLKIAMDRGGAQIQQDEIHRIHAWIENFYKEMSAIMGTLEGHITVHFENDTRGPTVAITEKGNAWLKEYQLAPEQ